MKGEWYFYTTNFDMKLYGSHLCKNCPPAIEYLTEKKVDYIFLDISNSLVALKGLLSYRDKCEEFNSIKENGKVGIPCLIDDEDNIYIGEEIYKHF